MATLREVNKTIRMVVSRLILMVIVLTLLTASSSFGFDGHRRGFVLGGGLGFSPVASWEVDGTTIDESGAGIGLNLLIGYAWDDQNMIVYEGNIAGWKSDFFLDRQVSQGFNGASWYHYFGETGRTAFATLGIGYITAANFQVIGHSSRSSMLSTLLASQSFSPLSS
ncbi:MAG: hypothetical protein IIC66_10870 [candidate division Zixibacteria bacterium]|nr:hypothetical protein [candidate division Zixibacteria bacterium]